VLWLGTTLSLTFVAIPLFYLARRALDSESQTLTAVVLRRKTLEIFLTTISLAALVVAVATILGVALAWILHNVALPFPNLCRALIILPIAIPSYVFTFCWISLFPSLQGFWAAVFVLVLSTTPFVTLAALAALRRVDWSQHEVAQTLGLNNTATFFQVTLPQIRNSVAAGSLLVALYVLSDFGAVSLLGVDTFTRAISNLYRGSFDRSTAAVLALILVAISGMIISIESGARSRTKVVKSSSRIINNSNLDRKLKSRSIAFVLISIFLVQQGSTFARLADKGVLIVHALPGIVMGLALVAFGSEFAWLYQTLGLLAFAYALLFMAKSDGAVRTSLSRVPQNLVDISATLGQTRSQTFRKVVLPLSAPGIFSGTLLVFLAAMKELPATLMLHPTGFETLATEMWTYTSIFRFSEAAPYALALILVAAVPTFLINRPDKNVGSDGDPS